VFGLKRKKDKGPMFVTPKPKPRAPLYRFFIVGEQTIGNTKYSLVPVGFETREEAENTLRVLDDPGARIVEGVDFNCPACGYVVKFAPDKEA
jgi:hypothetical protein